MPEETFRWVITGAVAISTLCIFIMAAIAIVMYRLMSKMQARTEQFMDDVKPLVVSAKVFARENGPKLTTAATRVREIADNAKDVSDVARDQAHRFAEVGRDIADRTKVQVARVDAVVEDTVEQAHQVGDNVKEAVMKPVREASGVLAGIKAAVSTYAQGRRPSVETITQDEEMFI